MEVTVGNFGGRVYKMNSTVTEMEHIITQHRAPLCLFIVFLCIYRTEYNAGV